MAASTIKDLASRARALRDARGRRVLIGIAGAPGAGKSTLADGLLDLLGAEAALVPMDGFHLSQRQLAELGRADRKGAPDTFDAAGFAAILRRVRETPGEDVFVPRFDRSIEEPIAAGLRVPAGAEIVLT
ncbi:MAG: nucleoside/nucleotide kinase family protein, partial [Nonomuraea sp.]|nr:nucleoside/nucleotide kinase family protein [Nonomuraea sp.]